MLIKDDGSKRFTVNQLIDRFYTSRFNRDNLHDPAPGEDVDDSRLYRLYNKSDVKELMQHLVPFFEWALIHENISSVIVSDDIHLLRDAELPKVKKATEVDVRIMGTLGYTIKPGDYYLTKGRYSWRMWITGKLYEKVKDLWMRDPERVKVAEELTPEVEAKNSAKK